MKGARIVIWGLSAALFVALLFGLNVGNELNHHLAITNAISEISIGDHKSKVGSVLSTNGIKLIRDARTGLLQDRSLSVLSYLREEWITIFHFDEKDRLTSVITEVHFQSDERDIPRLMSAS